MNNKMHVTGHVDTNKNDHEPVSDAELIKRFRMGDDNSFSAIVLRYQGRLVRTAQSILGDKDEAMDISQEAFVKAYFSLKKFRSDSSLYTWLYRIVYNLCLSSLRKKKIITFISFHERSETTDFPSLNPDPGVEFERKEIKSAVNNALQKLPPKQRMVFVMKQFDGLKHVEIAQIMGITEGAVKASHFHAVQKLRNLLSRYGEAYGL
ncbi:RNA polymerase sigma factor [Candidatus Latescibacterota bacterium]